MKKLAIASALIATPLLCSLNEPVSATPKNAFWRRMNEKEEISRIKLLINNRLGIAALNQLALEGFTGDNCNRRFYLYDPYVNGQFIMRVNCNTPRGVSDSIAYDEIRVTFFRQDKGNITDFEIERISAKGSPPEIKLPN